MGQVRTFFTKILQGVRFLVDGYVYTGPYSNMVLIALLQFEKIFVLSSILNPGQGRGVPLVHN